MEIKRKINSLAPFNAKYKIYPDGTMIATYSSIPVFKFVSDNVVDTVYINEKRLNTEFPDKDYIIDFPAVYVRHTPYDIVVDPLTGELTLYGAFADYNRSVSDKSKKQRSDNVKRARDKIYDLVMLNEWNYFFTGTLGDTPFDPTSAAECVNPLQNWLRNMSYRHGLKYVLVAEYQPKSGKIHFHGFINDALKVEDSGRRLYKALGDKKSKAYDVDFFKRMKLNPDDYPIIYNIPQWKFGFTTAIKSYNGSMGCANYIRKYITKENKAIFGRYYWSSRNLVREPVMAYDDVDYDSIISKEYSIPRVKNKFKYYTFFPGQNDFHYKQASDNSADILAMLEDFEEIESDDSLFPEFEEI